MPGISQIDKHTPRSRRAGDARSVVKKGAARKARRLSRKIAKGNEKAEGSAIYSGWAD